MKIFPMCPACQAEYDDSRDRRFHAQPNACPACGPQLELWSGTGEVMFGGNQALLAAAQMIRRGQIVAVKGVGGFHLFVDGRNEESLRRLRQRKHREEKPFALMFPTISSVKCLCHVSPLEERLLRSSEAPIVLLKRIAHRQSPIAFSAAPGNPCLGVMLPSNPLQHLLLLDQDFPVVATSGNLSDEPICTDEREALDRLRGIADAFLVHNRPILRHLDDSIVRVIVGREMVLRRARGYAPLPVSVAAGILPAVEPRFQPGQREVAKANTLRIEKTQTDVGVIPGGKLPPATAGVTPAATVLAVGAHLKNAVALAVGENVFISQHIGDLETAPAADAFRRAIRDLETLYGAEPAIVAADLHPDYLSTRFARDSRKNYFGVQHHVAHVLSCMAENGILLPALGVAWDGTGYGTDGTIWGGEFFLVTNDHVERVAHLRPFRLPGGEKAIKEPRRAAIGLLYELYGEAAFEMDPLEVLRQMPPSQRSALKTMLRRRLNSPYTSSAGRLFDAVASLINLRQSVTFEGQAAMELEWALAGVDTDEAYSLSLAPHPPPLVLDWSPMIDSLLEDVNAGVSKAVISARFHNTLAEAVLTVAKKVGEPRVALSGGCFQNAYLSQRVVTRLQAEHFEPHCHQRVPPNDGGIALGQMFAARNHLHLR